MSTATKEQKRAEYLKHRDKYLARAKKWAEDNPNKRKEVLKKWNSKASDYKRSWRQNKDFGVIVQLDECALCFTTEKLVVHHRDGNNGKLGKELNNEPSNLVVLCRKCHPKVHYRGEVRILV